MPKSKYKVIVPPKHRKVRDDERVNRAKSFGSRSKYKIAFVSRRRKIGYRDYGRVFQIFIDPRDKQGRFGSTEAYELTREQVNKINEMKESTCLDILTSPVDRVQFRWISRDLLRTIRRMNPTKLCK